MNIKTLSTLTGVPYTTIANSRNRPDSIPTADVALKIARVLNKSLDCLLGESAVLPKTEEANELHELSLYHKYERLIASLEKKSPRTQESFITLALAISED